MKILLTILQQGGPGGTGDFLAGMLPFLLIILVFYFLLIRPQAKKQKEHQKMLQSLQPGDAVVTSGGIHGKIVAFKDEKTLILKVDDKVKLTVDRSAISGVVRPSKQKEKEKESAN